MFLESCYIRFLSFHFVNLRLFFSLVNEFCSYLNFFSATQMNIFGYFNQDDVLWLRTVRNCIEKTMADQTRREPSRAYLNGEKTFSAMASKFCERDLGRIQSFVYRNGLLFDDLMTVLSNL